VGTGNEKDDIRRSGNVQASVSPPVLSPQPIYTGANVGKRELVNSAVSDLSTRIKEKEDAPPAPLTSDILTPLPHIPPPSPSTQAPPQRAVRTQLRASVTDAAKTFDVATIAIANTKSTTEWDVSKFHPLVRLTFDPSSVEIAQCIVPLLYLSGDEVAYDRAELRRLNVKCILNTAIPDCKNMFEKELEYKAVRLEDDEDEPIEKYFDECLTFIHNARTAGKAVLVHCLMGMSRSASIVLAYLMRFEGYTLSAAYWHTKRRRLVISPNDGFMRQLVKLEQELFGKTTIDPDDYEEKRDDPAYNPSFYSDCVLKVQAYPRDADNTWPLLIV